MIDERDAELTNYKPVVTESCKADFFMVGGGAVFDDTGTKERLECLLPNVAGYVVTPEAVGSELQIQPVPNSNSMKPRGSYAFLAKKYKGSGQHIGILAADLPATTTIASQDEEILKSLGLKVVYTDRYPVAAVTSWSPYVQSMKDKGVAGSSGSASRRTWPSWSRRWWTRTSPSTGCAATRITTTTSSSTWAARRSRTRTSRAPSCRSRMRRRTLRPSSTSTRSRSTCPNGKARAQLGVQAWSSWLLFSKAAGACGANLTRKCVYDNLAKYHEWTGGGLHAVTDPGANTPTDCFVLLNATPKGFTVADVDPNEGIFNCSPKNLVELQGDYGKGVTLADAGKKAERSEVAARIAHPRPHTSSP